MTHPCHCKTSLESRNPTRLMDQVVSGMNSFTPKLLRQLSHSHMHCTLSRIVRFILAVTIMLWDAKNCLLMLNAMFTQYATNSFEVYYPQLSLRRHFRSPFQPWHANSESAKILGLLFQQKHPHHPCINKGNKISIATQ